jgi:POT family
MLLQGERMDARIANEYVVPAAALNFVKMLIITLLLPILDRVVYPLMGYFGRKPTLLQRIGERQS